MSDAKIGREILTLTFVNPANGSTITANHFVGYDSNIGAADAAVLGVARDDVSAGKVGDVVVMGTAYVETSENLTAGQPVACDTGGKAKLADSGEEIVGRAWKNSNSGDFAEIILGNEGVV